MVIKCLEPIDMPIACLVYRQYCRCNFAKSTLGEDWGTEKAEKSNFVDPRTNKTSGPVDFIKNGFPSLG